MAEFCYKELCFTVDHFYGMPGRSPYENAIRETRRKMVIEHYHISEEDMDVIFRTLSSAGWLTMTDLIEETGHTKSTLGRALAVMDNVVSVNSGTSMLYRRVRTL